MHLADSCGTERKRTIKRVAAWSGLLLGLVFLVLGLIYFTDKPEPETAAQELHPVPNSGRVVGNPNSPISLVEYSDYQCRRCAYYHLIVTQLLEEVGDEFRLIFRHYPLRNHANALAAAIAAESAGRQGKFWEMHDLLFSHQDQWAEKEQTEALEIFSQYAASLSLDVFQFHRDFLSQEIIEKVNNDYQEGRRAGVRSTPTFFLNGQKIMNKPPTYEGFKALILETKSELN